MLTTIDPAAATGTGAQAPTLVRRPETDKVAELYQTPRLRDADRRDSVAPEPAEEERSARPAEKTAT